MANRPGCGAVTWVPSCSKWSATQLTDSYHRPRGSGERFRGLPVNPALQTGPAYSTLVKPAVRGHMLVGGRLYLSDSRPWRLPGGSAGRLGSN